MICTVIIMNLPTHLVWTIFESSFIILKEEILEHMTYHCRFVPHSKQRCPRPTSARGTRADNTLNYCYHGSIHSQPVARLDPLIWKRPPPPLVAEENLQSNTEHNQMQQLCCFSFGGHRTETNAAILLQLCLFPVNTLATTTINYALCASPSGGSLYHQIRS